MDFYGLCSLYTIVYRFNTGFPGRFVYNGIEYIQLYTKCGLNLGYQAVYNLYTNFIDRLYIFWYTIVYAHFHRGQ